MGTETFDLTATEARMYEEWLVPAIFAEWAPRVVAAGGVAPGHHVIDVGCGTGIVARAAAAAVGEQGRVVGLDPSEAMLDVARTLSPDLAFEPGTAGELPFPDDAFDVALSQAALMFVPDATAALAEMGRVARARVAVQVFSSLSDQPGYGPWVDLVADVAGAEAYSLLGTYWVHGDLPAFTTRCRDAGLRVVEVQEHLGTARFDSAAQLVDTELGATPLGQRLQPEQVMAVRERSERLLSRYVDGNGLAVPLAGRIVVAEPA